MKMLKMIPAEEPSGITLDFAQVQINPGRKATAKLMLNSFRGKFGERQNKSVTVTVQEPSHLFSLLTDDTLDISNILSVLKMYWKLFTQVNMTQPIKVPK